MELIKVYRDVPKCKITPKYIDKLLDITSVNIEKEYIIPSTPGELSSRLLCQYDDIFRFRNISYEHKQLIQDIFTEILRIDQKVLNRAYTKAEGGR